MSQSENDPHEHDSRLKKVIATVGAQSIETTLTVRDHCFICDETEPLGGHDNAPDPYDYILGGLGACTAISLREYANRKQWPLERVEVRLTYQRLDTQKSGVGIDSKPDRIDRNITLVGPLSEKQKNVLQRVVDCPAHRMLSGGIDIETEIVTSVA